MRSAKGLWEVGGVLFARRHRLALAFPGRRDVLSWTGRQLLIIDVIGREARLWRVRRTYAATLRSEWPLWIETGNSHFDDLARGRRHPRDLQALAGEVLDLAALVRDVYDEHAHRGENRVPTLVRALERDAVLGHAFRVLRAQRKHPDVIDAEALRDAANALLWAQMDRIDPDLAKYEGLLH